MLIVHVFVLVFYVFMSEVVIVEIVVLGLCLFDWNMYVIDVTLLWILGILWSNIFYDMLWGYVP